jgi:hypothetical protein
MTLSAAGTAGGSGRKKELEAAQQLLAFVQGLLQQLAAGAHDLSTCVQRALKLKSHSSAKQA